ncbi:islet cell autoantigen 1-like isoform X2 [Centropristis striata]|uniref:islet cell autoantigen 1-like isoform X2 n=1 Tax=Centropristis striata TaxID=184440 RepID=UPI0027E1AB63|nr:islet cell autoantigen 1-like isoform X2 [Centropristis striata]
MDGLAGEMLAGVQDSSVMARMQKKFWKTKQVLIKATGKKEDEYVVASDADLDAKLEFFRSVQVTCTELLKVIEKYQHRITRLSQEENELGLFLRFQSEHDKTKAGNIMDATSKALCSSAKQRMSLCPPLRRLLQEVETFRRRAISDSLLTVSRMERSRTEYRGALLWMKDVSQELDPDTYKQLEKFRKVQSQVRGTKSQFEKLKNDVCQKVDMLGASRCNMLSHSLCTYQTTLLHFWEKTAQSMLEIHQSFQGYVPYQFTTLKELRDPLEELTELQRQKETQETAHSLVSLDEEQPPGGAPGADSTSSTSEGQLRDSALLSSLSAGGDLMLLTSDLPGPPGVPLQPPAAPQGGELLLLQPPASGAVEEEEEGERGDMAFLKDLLSPGPGSNDDFSREWQDAFGVFDQPSTVSTATTTVSTATTGVAASGGGGAPPAAQPSSPTGFLPSQLLDHSLSSTGWSTPPMFQAPPLQPPPPGRQTTTPAPSSAANGSKDMSVWFDLFADLDPLSNPDAIGRSPDQLLNA